MQIPVRVEKMFGGGLWPWKASTWINGKLFLEIGFTRAGTLRRLQKSIRYAKLPKAKPVTVQLEID